MERGTAITLVVIAMVLVLGVLAFVFFSYLHENNYYDVNDDGDKGDNSYTISKTTTYSRSSGDTSTNYDDNRGTAIIIVDNAGNTGNIPANTNYGPNQVYGMNYGTAYVNTNTLPTDYYGNRVLMDRYANRVYDNSVSYYYDGYRDGEFRCVDYYDRGDGIIRNHCSRIVDDDYRHHHYDDNWDDD